MSSSSALACRSTRALALAATALLLSGCAGMTQTECRSSNWYDVGYRDGDIYGLRPQIDQYAHQCKAFGVTPAEKDYLTGWVDGYREFISRMTGSDCCAP
jgi:hypothetical protein